MLWGYIFPLPNTIGLRYYNGRIFGAYTYTDTVSYVEYPHITFFEADTNLNIIWKRTYKCTDTIFRWDLDLRHIFVDNSGNFYVIQSSFILGFFNHYPVVLKFDTLGNLLWWKSYAWDSTETVFDMKISAALLKDAILLASGVYVEGDSVFKIHGAAMKLDTSGNVVWAKTYGKNGALTYLTNIVPSDSLGSSYYIIGRFRHLVVGKIGGNGDKIWFKAYDVPDYVEPGLNSALLVGDKLIFGGSDGGSYYNLIKIDTLGIPYMRKYVYPYTSVVSDVDDWELIGGNIQTQFRPMVFDTGFNLLRDTVISARVLERVGNWYIVNRVDYLSGITTILKANPSLQTCDDTLTKEYIYTVSATMPSIIDYTDTLTVMDWTTRINVLNFPFVEVSPDTFSFRPYCSVKITENLKEPKSKTLEIYDVAGRLIYEGDKNPELKRGVYFIRRNGKVFKEIRR